MMIKAVVAVAAVAKEVSVIMELFQPDTMKLTKYLFFTGKGGVGKTSIACATAVRLSDQGKKVLLISTDPASNLQDVFDTELDNKGVKIADVPGLVVANLNPVQAAAEYRESVVAPYRGKLPESVITNMEEQLSGSCTVEIAAFNEFSRFITDESLSTQYDYIIFDTAPTGHTLRMLQLPSAWSGFISESTHGASCLGQLSGLESKREVYKKAVETLADIALTTLILVTRPEETPIKEAARAADELSQLGIRNQRMVINGLLTEHSDDVSDSLYNKQQAALLNMPQSLNGIETCFVPLRAYNVTGIAHIRSLLTENEVTQREEKIIVNNIPHLKEVIEDLYRSKKRLFLQWEKVVLERRQLQRQLHWAWQKRV